MHKTFSQILSIVCRIHQHYLPPTLPVRTKSILDKLINKTSLNFQVSTYQGQAIAEGWEPTPLNFIRHFKSIDGKIIFIPKEQIYVLFYNRNRLAERKKWTIAHELGHYFCDHLLQTYKSTPASLEENKQREQQQEIEANRFARYLLAPPWILIETAGQYGCKDAMTFYALCRYLFRLSKEASYFVAISTAANFQKFGIEPLHKDWDTLHTKYVHTLSDSIFTQFPTRRDFESLVSAYSYDYNLLNLLHAQNKLGTLMHGPYSMAQCMHLY